VARRVESYLNQQEPLGLNVLYAAVIERARARQEAAERDAVAGMVRDAIASSGLSAKEFASHIGTSASRLSTYARGQVVPSATLLLRMEKLAQSFQPQTSSVTVSCGNA
jgi:DNA-binding transcriptional regulator YiaG